MSYLQKRKLFVFDLDGTALTPGQEPYARLTDPFSRFLDEISVDGWTWGINSTWDVLGQLRLVLVSRVKSRPSFLMGEMGMRLAAVVDSQIEFVQPYTEMMERKVQGVVENELYAIMNRICSRFHPSRMHFYGHLFDFTADEKEKAEFDDFTSKITGDGLVIGKGAGRFTAYPALLNKGESLKEIIRITNLLPENIVVAGDAVADIPMMAPDISKHPICPANAPDEVKRHVKSSEGIVGTKPYAEGVIEGFYQLIGNKAIPF